MLQGKAEIFISSKFWIDRAAEKEEMEDGSGIITSRHSIFLTTVYMINGSSCMKILQIFFHARKILHGFPYSSI